MDDDYYYDYNADDDGRDDADADNSDGNDERSCN